MAQKQSLSFNFSQGLELKQDPKQIPAGKFLNLENTIFDMGGLLQKRNGFGQLTVLPNTNSTFLTTFNNNLTAISNSILAYSDSNNSWVSKGSIVPLSINTQPLIRSNTTQSQADIAISSNNLICTVFTDQNTSNLSTPVYKYVVADADTGQNVIAPTALPGSTVGSPRVFVLGTNFIVLFTSQSGSVFSLEFIAINTATIGAITGPVVIDSSYSPSTSLSFDANEIYGNLYVVYNTLSGGQAIQACFINNSLQVSSKTVYSGFKATTIGLTNDGVNLYCSFYDSVSQNGYAFSFNQVLSPLFTPVLIISGLAVVNITLAVQNSLITTYYEVSNTYTFTPNLPTNYIGAIYLSTSGGTPSASRIVIRSVGLASKAFIVAGVEYFLAAFQSTYQPSYFLIQGTSTSASPQVIAKLAYSNGGGYLTTGLPNVVVSGLNASIPYLYKDSITSVSKATNLPAGSQTAGIYSQLGINYATFNFSNKQFDSVEIASSLHMSGGFLWQYDGYLPVEHNFLVWPDDITVTWSDTGGSMPANPTGWVSGQPSYAYQVIYEWTDNQGNAHRSAPSVPVYVTLGTDASTAGSATINIPTLRLTYKTANPVKVTVYRWSIAQQNYYQTTSITLPTLNSTTIDSVTFVDTQTDSAILGNALVYTTGGVVEDISAPGSNIMTLWQTRLFLVDAEDQNLIWFSKQVIENTPVEMSDLLTMYIAPTIGASGSTGPITALGAMDDKLIIFKKDAIYYVSGTGPDNTGANNLFTDPIFITGVTGCTNQQSLIITPNGMMFQSDKGIWLLDRSLGTTYIGAPVEPYALSANVKSAVLVPGTNQVRFTLDSNITLMYDYFYSQWNTFTGLFGISSCIYNSLHTYLDSYGRVFQETPGQYLDGTLPTLISFTTGWLNLAGVSGYQRIYEFAFLGSYITPHFLDIRVGYDFADPTQQSIIQPTNYTGVYGSDSLYGQTSPYGGPGSLEQWRIHTNTQKCQTFQITFKEVFNPAYSNVAGQGFNLTALNCVIGTKSSYRPYRGLNSVG